MTPLEIVDLIRQENPALLGKVPDKLAARIIRAACLQISRQVDAADEGNIVVAGLGSFRVRQIEQERAGEKMQVKRVIFHVAKRGAGKSPV